MGGAVARADRGYVLTTSIAPAPGVHVESEAVRPDGLLWGHEYAVLRLQEMAVPGTAQAVRLISLMNPHGKGDCDGGPDPDPDSDPHPHPHPNPHPKPSPNLNLLPVREPACHPKGSGMGGGVTRMPRT